MKEIKSGIKKFGAWRDVEGPAIILTFSAVVSVLQYCSKLVVVTFFFAVYASFQREMRVYERGIEYTGKMLHVAHELRNRSSLIRPNMRIERYTRKYLSFDRLKTIVSSKPRETEIERLKADHTSKVLIRENDETRVSFSEKKKEKNEQRKEKRKERKKEVTNRNERGVIGFEVVTRSRARPIRKPVTTSI